MHPLPEDPRLNEAALFLGFLGPDSIGMTLGNAIFIKAIFFDLRVLAHECRHVCQFEQSGSIAAFLPRFVASILEFGSFFCPYEEDPGAVEGLAPNEEPGP